MHKTLSLLFVAFVLLSFPTLQVGTQNFSASALIGMEASHHGGHGPNGPHGPHGGDC